MLKKRGKLIVIEGTDGTGKATQTKILLERAKQENFSVETISFPRYETPTGKLVRAYLNGEYGNPTEVNWQFASALYAVDRLAAKRQILEWLSQGCNIISDRYISANQGHQIAKINEEGTARRDIERITRDNWLEVLEYEHFGMPQPDETIFLFLPAEQAREAALKQGRKLDGHEADLKYQKKVVDTYLWLAATKHWRTINCMTDTKRKTIDEVAEEIWKLTRPLLVKQDL